MDLVLDIYDDPEAKTLASYCRSAGAELPEKYASSSLLPSEGLAALPDRLFALLAMHEGNFLRKYAMHDEAHLATSILYFLEHGKQLDADLQIKVATNLVNACAWYDVDPPDPLLHLAMRNKVQPHRFVEKPGEIEWENLTSYLNDEGQRKLLADFHSVGIEADPFKSSRAKQANITGTSSGSQGALPNDPRGKTPERAGLMPKVSELRIRQRSKSAKQDSGALSTPAEVKQAAALLDRRYPDYTREERYKVSAHIQTRATALGVKVAGIAASYTPDGTYGDRIATELQKRVDCFADTPKVAGYQLLQDRLEATPPAVMADMLQHLDRETGVANQYDSGALGFADPWCAVFGKTAGRDEDGVYRWSKDGLYVAGDTLHVFAKSSPRLDHVFGEGFSTKFAFSPISAFQSLNDDQKMVLCRLANALADRTP